MELSNCKQLPANFVVLDLESTGLDTTGECGILEIGAVDGMGRKFYRRVSLPRGMHIQTGALECNGIDPLDLVEGQPLERAMCDLSNWLKAGVNKWIMGGKNPQFDYALLKAFWPTGVVGISLHEVISRRCVDLHSVMYSRGIVAGVDMTVEGFSTDDLYLQLISLKPEPKPHNALRGALHEMEAFKRTHIDGYLHRANPEAFESYIESIDRKTAMECQFEVKPVAAE